MKEQYKEEIKYPSYESSWASTSSNSDTGNLYEKAEFLTYNDAKLGNKLNNSSEGIDMGCFWKMEK